MAREVLFSATLQSAALFLLVWVAFRLAPKVPANAKAWTWRLAFLKPLLGLLPFAAVSLRILPPPVPAAPVFFPAFSNGRSLIAPERAAVPPPPTGFDPLFLLWLAGTAGIAGSGLRDVRRAIRLVQRSAPAAEPVALSALEELAARAGLRRVPRLHVSPEVQGPVLVGGWRATIVLPSTAPPADVRSMLAHEVGHLARRDLVWFGAIWAVQALFFFNPMVWPAARRARLDHESATDQEAVRLAAVPVQAYATMLLRATVVARRSLVPGVVPMAESYRSIHQRLEAMRHFNPQPSRRRPFAIGALVLATALLLPLYRLAEAAPQNGPGQGRANAGTLLYSAPKNPKNPFKYSVYKVGDQFWIQAEKDGTVRRYLWDDGKPRAGKVTGTGLTSVNCEFAQTDAREALRQLFRFSKAGFVIDPDVQGTITLKCQNLAFETVLTNALRQVDATFELQNGTYHIRRAGSETKP